MHKLFSGGWVGPAEVGGSLFVLLFSMNYYRSFLQWNAMRSDVKTATLSDPVLQLLTPMDCSIVMSAVVYGMLVAGSVYCRNKPDVFITAAQTLTLALWTRMLMIYLVPVKSPRGAIPLSSSIHETVGSAPSLVACTLLAVTRRHHCAWRWAFASFAMVSGLLGLAQKLQYTADLITTPSLVTLVASVVAAVRQTVGQITSKAKLKKL
ncbi:hypothetical protein Poli38472_006784 [Pythium oligandrum]|uniref:Uncharacterized protein n=1 Tax=Pythium oligandrum TaxID=41045 RepID=A0A8K1FDD4_PYTOL|nr:hypothetical protein Poli38472_006784 [Pythium oligandrum]|eukprot:TMW56774.1 hypothetical protein Poli38472_006784 [Pythium oligandrum]